MGLGVDVEIIKTDDFKKLKEIVDIVESTKEIVDIIESTKVYNGRYVKSYDVKSAISDDFFEMTIILYDY